MIYFAETPTGSIKISCSENVDARMEQLRAHYGAALSLLWTMEGGREEERGMHERFSHLRLGRTEQFRPGPDLMAFVGRPLLVDANPDAVGVIPSVAQEGRPNDVVVKLDRAVAAQARYVAETRGISLAEFLSTLLRPVVAREFEKTTRGGGAN